MPDQFPGYFQNQLTRNVPAVSGACLALRMSAFRSVDGFSADDLPNCYYDVDLCLKLLDKGFRNAWTPFRRLRGNPNVCWMAPDPPGLPKKE